MTAPTDDQDRLNSGIDPFAGESAEERDAREKKKKDDSGEGDSDSFGRGKAGAGAGRGGGVKISTQKLKQIMADWRQLDVSELAEVVAEFFGDVLRASAQLVTDFVTKANVKSFAIVDQSIKAGHRMARDRERARARSAEVGGGIFGGGSGSGGGRSGGGGDSRKNTNAVGNKVKAASKPMAIIPGINGPNGPGGAR